MQVGDPTLWAWIIVAGYGVAALFSARAARLHYVAGAMNGDAVRQRTLTRFWLILTVLMVVLGLNKQLDLQTQITQLGRALARSEGWYSLRRPVQMLLVAGSVAAGLVAIVATTIVLRRYLRDIGDALFGVCFLFTFIAIRAASFHHVDHWLGAGIIRRHWLIECAGIALVLVSALRQSAVRRRAALVGKSRRTL